MVGRADSRIISKLTKVVDRIHLFAGLTLSTLASYWLSPGRYPNFLGKWTSRNGLLLLQN